MSQLVRGARVVTQGGVLDDGWVEVHADRIVRLGRGRPPSADDELTGGSVVVPGFVDLHVHGGGGASFDAGNSRDAEDVVRFHRAHGTTTTMGSLVTASRLQLVERVSALAPLVHAGALAGLHLEGPWLSSAHAGAHDPSLLRAPEADELQAVLAAGGGAVRIVTLAPELPGAVHAVRAAVAAGAVVAVGHTDASYEVTRNAIAEGARLGTHLFNAMRPLRHREPGPVAALLEDPRVTVELIADGVHIHPAVLRMVISQVGPSRVALVTDAMAAAGTSDGTFRLGSMEVDVRDGVARLSGQDVIAGSTLTMDAAFRFAVVACDVSLADAATMTSCTPARVLGRADVGDIEVGRRADLVVLDDDLAVKAVMVAGRWVPDVLS